MLTALYAVAAVVFAFVLFAPPPEVGRFARSSSWVLAVVAVIFASGALAAVDPADAAAATMDPIMASVRAPPAPARDPGVFLAVVAAVGALIRTVIIPLLKSPLAGSIFKRVPPFVQQLILVALACVVGALDAFAAGGTLTEAVLAALAAYGTAAALYGLTAPAVEKRARA